MNTHLPLRNIPRAALYSKQRGIRERQEKEKIPMNLKSNSFLPSRYPNSTLDSTLAYVSLRTESVHRLFATTTTLGLTTGSNLNIYTIRKLRLASWRFNSWRTLTSTRSLESGLLSRRNRIGTNRKGRRRACGASPRDRDSLEERKEISKRGWVNFYSSPRADVINLYIASKSGFKDEIRRERSYRHVVIIDGTRRYETVSKDVRQKRREKREIVLVFVFPRRRYECKFNFSFRAKEATPMKIGEI